MLINALEKSTVCVIEGGKIRSTATIKSATRSTLILRDVPSDAPVDEVREIFNFENCRGITSLHSDIGDTWFVIFENEDDAKDTLNDLREKGRTFRGKAVKGRVKSETVVRSYFPVQAAPMGGGMPMYPPGAIPPFPPFMAPGVMQPPFGYPNMVPNGGMPVQFSEVDAVPMMKAAQSPSAGLPGALAAASHPSTKPAQSPTAANGQASGNGKAVRNSGGNKGNSRAGNSGGTPKAGANEQAKAPSTGASTGTSAAGTSGTGNEKRKKGNTPKAGKEGDPGFDGSLMNFPPLHDGPVPAAPTPKAFKANLMKPSTEEPNSGKQHGIISETSHNPSEQMQALSLEDARVKQATKAKSTSQAATQTTAARVDSNNSSTNAADSSSLTLETSAPKVGSYAGILLSGSMTTPTETVAVKPGKKTPSVDKGTNTSSPAVTAAASTTTTTTTTATTAAAATAAATTPERKSAGSDEKKTSNGSRGREKDADAGGREKDADAGGRKARQNSGGSKKKVTIIISVV